MHLDSVSWLLPSTIMLAAVKAEQDEESGDAYGLVMRWDSLDQSSGHLQGLQVLQLGLEAMVEPDATSAYDGPYLHTVCVPQWGAVVYANRKVGGLVNVLDAVRPAMLQGSAVAVLQVGSTCHVQATCISKETCQQALLDHQLLWPGHALDASPPQPKLGFTCDLPTPAEQQRPRQCDARAARHCPGRERHT